MNIIIGIVFIITCLVIFVAYRLNHRSHRRGRALIQELIEHARIVGDREAFDRIMREEQNKDRNDEGPPTGWVAP
jgi:hypothetical protein